MADGLDTTQAAQPQARHGLQRSSNGMYPCEQCGRRFATRTSLNRHAQNHSKELAYVCPVCDVAFHRHDLLTRHIKLHDEQQLSESGPHKVKRRLRKRCHTACDRCRNSKIKCDSQQPCSACASAGKACLFDSSSGRLSRVLPTTQRWSPPTEGSSLQSNHQASEKSRSPITSSAMAGGNQSPGQPGAHQAPFSDQGLDMPPTLPENTNGSYDPFSGSGAEGVPQLVYPSPLDAMPWAWMHENAFLPADDDFSMASLITADIGLPIELYADTVMGGGETFEVDIDPNMELPQPHDYVTTTVDPPARDESESMRSTNPKPAATASEAQDCIRTEANDRADCISSKRQAVEDVISSVWTGETLTTSPRERKVLWGSASVRVEQTFQLPSPKNTDSEASTLQTFVKLYFDHFHPLWPLLSLQDLDLDNLHPLLLLSLSSIGAMYGGGTPCEYGSMMHTALCERLATPLELQYDNGGKDLLWLAQARLLTQVAALYFGQPKAFSYAQHLGVLLIAQARKLNLFSHQWYYSRMEIFHHMKGLYSDSERLAVWLEVETRRRLAFGIFRGDTFTSIILDTKPLVSLDEIHLEFPACDSVWAGPKMSSRQALDAIDHDRTPSKSLRASDAFHIMMERDEILPPLEPLAHELLIFGLQWPLWRFSQDDQLFERMTGRCHSEELLHMLTGQNKTPRKRTRWNTMTSEAESLDTVSREMADLSTDLERLLSALCKWERALPVVKTFARDERDRSFILSSLILFHMGYMRLLGPIGDIHRVQYRLANSRPPDDALLEKVARWARLPQARLAVNRASSIWSLLAKESLLEAHQRSKVNLVAFVGLHHGAALLWAFVGCRSEKTENEWFSEIGFELPQQLVTRSSSMTKQTTAVHHSAFDAFVEIYGRVSSAGWSSFADATDVLSHNPFPLQGHQVIS